MDAPLQAWRDEQEPLACLACGLVVGRGGGGRQD